MSCSLADPGLWIMIGSVGVGIFFYMLFWFGASQYFKRLDIVDSAWGLGFIYAALLALLLQPYPAMLHYVVFGLVALWGLRLTTHISKRNIGKPEDSRYAALRKKWGKQLAVKSFLNVFMLQGALIVVISIPVITIMSATPANMNLVTLVGLFVWIVGIVVEALADYQLQQFVKTKRKGQIMQSGLWRYSRHPNYFGEITTWWGAGIVAASLGGWWGFVGSILITILIVKVSGVPLLEKKYAHNPAFKAYKKRTSLLIPLPP